MVALKSEENELLGTQSTHMMVFELETGKVLMEETEIPGDSSGGVKYEGLVFT